jgi:sulfite reductase (NADPH) flavoprotein alpha-component
MTSLASLPQPHSAVSNVQLSKVLKNTRLTSETHFQDTRNIRFEFNLDYNVGDILMIQPKNDQNLVTELLAYMNLDPKSLISINTDESQTH